MSWRAWRTAGAAFVLLHVSCTRLEPPSQSPSATSGTVATPDRTQNATGVVLSPNTIRGTIRFANSNPDILTLLQTEGMDGVAVNANSIAPTGYSANNGYHASDDHLHGSYQLSAEAGSDDDGVTYTVAAYAWVNRGARSGSSGLGNGQYYFAPQQVTLKPDSVQPNGLTLDFVETLGVVRIRFGTDPSCATPVSIMQANIGTGQGFNYLNSAQLPGYSMGYYLMRGGTRFNVTISTILGTSVTLDTITLQNTVEFHAGSDEFQDVCIVIPSTTDLGAIASPLQIFGHTLVPRVSYIHALDGPQGNQRITYVNGIGPVDQPSLWPRLPNLVPGDYRLAYGGLLDYGDAQVAFYTSLAPTLPQTAVTAGQMSDARHSFSDGEHYPFVSHPARFRGSVRLYDRYVADNPGASSSLSSLSFHTQWPINDTNFYPGGTVRGPSHGTALTATRNGTYHYTSFAGRFDAPQGELGDSYLLPITTLYDQPEQYLPPTLRLVYASEPQVLINGNVAQINHDYDYHIYYVHPALVNPPTYRLGMMSLSQLGGPQTLRADTDYTQNHHYCFSEVRLQYTSRTDPFVDPSAAITGGFDGIDFEGNSVHYTGTGTFYGTPPVGGYQPTSVFLAARSHTGQLSFALPQGSWHFSPGAIFVHDAGTISSGTFPSVGLTVGCGQRVALVPGLSVSIQFTAACQGNNAATVEGTVDSSNVEIDHVWYTLGNQTVDVCTSACPRNFRFDVPVAASGMPLVVYASSPFIDGVASVSDVLPNCTLPNTPPTLPALPDLQVEAQGPSGAPVDFPSPVATDLEDGPLVATCVPAPGSLFPLGATLVTCTATDSGGLTAEQQFTVTVRDTTPPTLTAPTAVVQLACNRVVNYQVTAWDLVSGTVTPACTPPSGSLFPLGESTVTCTATDAAGNTATIHFVVNVNFDTAFSGFLSPLAWQRIAPKGQSAATGLPVKFRLLCDGQPAAVEPRLFWASGSGADVGAFQPATSKGGANTDNLFRLAGQQWIFNLDVRLLGDGVRTLRVDFGDGRTHDVVILVD